jgi:hypothetical protein
MIKDVITRDNRSEPRLQSSVVAAPMGEESKPPQAAVADAIHLLQTFRGLDLTGTIYGTEKSLKGGSADGYSAVLTTSGANGRSFEAALADKGLISLGATDNRMSGINRDHLSTVEQVPDFIREREGRREKKTPAWDRELDNQA